MCQICNYLESKGTIGKTEGIRARFLCPFHSEDTPSLLVYHHSDRESDFYCFGCTVGGSTAELIRRLEFSHLPEKEGYREAFKLVNGTHSQTTKVMPLTILQPPSRTKRIALEAAMLFYSAELEKYQQAQDYLQSRGITMDTARELCLGYCSGHSGKELCKYVGNDVSTELETLGILDGTRERMARRIIIPNIRGGKIVWLQGRAIDNSRLRYLGITGPKVGLYGWETLGRPGPKVLVEGFFDLVPFLVAGYGGIAFLGNIDKNISLLKDKLAGQDVIIARDRGEGGDRMTELVTKALSGLSNVRVLFPPSDCKDPSQWVSQYGIGHALAAVA